MKVFISHSGEDRELARQLADALRLRDPALEVWEESNIYPGDNWAAEIGKALEAADAMVVLLTPEGAESNAVSNNVSYALVNKRFAGRLIPVLAGAAEDRVPWILKNLATIRMDPQAPAPVIESIYEQLQDAA